MLGMLERVYWLWFKWKVIGLPARLKSPDLKGLRTSRKCSLIDC